MPNGPIFRDDRRRIVGNDPHSIIPQGVTHGAVIPLDLQVRITTDYDIAFLEDRVVAEIFINRQPTGCRAVAKVDDREFDYRGDGLMRAMERYGPDLQRMAVEEFLGLGLRRKVDALEGQVTSLTRRVDDLEQRSRATDSEVRRVRARAFRPPWYKRVAFNIATWWV